MHGYLQAENCQNVKLNLQYGVVSHFNEPGIHKIDLKNKLYETFINTTLYGCRSTFGLAYSSVTKYAFVQCLGRLKGHTTSKILIIDVKREKVAKTDAALTFGVTGTPYASPDGKYVLIINQDKVYYVICLLKFYSAKYKTNLRESSYDARIVTILEEKQIFSPSASEIEHVPRHY